MAWTQLDGTNGVPQAIRPTRKSRVFKLIGAAPRGGNVVAKKCRNDNLLESYVYGDVLPRLAVSTPHYYGQVTDRESRSDWLFIEDVGNVTYRAQSTAHQALVSEWLGELHTEASGLIKPERLPDRNAAWFLEVTRLIRSSIRRQPESLDRLGRDRGPFEAIADDCDALEAVWHKVEAVCACVPPTLVHCDFVPKNIGVRAVRGGGVLLPFDWEMAGWGTPAPDIANLLAPQGARTSKSQLIASTRGGDAQRGIRSYWSRVHELWPRLEPQALERLAWAGHLFRNLLAVRWELAGTFIDDGTLDEARPAPCSQGGADASGDLPRLDLPRAHLEHIVEMLSLYSSQMGSVLPLVSAR
jgi:thiamine kinase-like enzyme